MQMIKKYSRKWHIWLGVAFAIPLLIVGMTTIFLAHDKALKLDEHLISSSYFPGYYGSKMVSNEIKSYFKDAEGVEYFGYKLGLHVKKDGVSTPLAFFDKHEIRRIEKLGDTLLVGTKKALFMEHKNGFKEVLKKDIWDVSVREGMVSVTTNKEGLFQSSDLKTWHSIQTQTSQSELKSVSLKKLNLDLHTGKALFGDTWMWIWQDILALCILFFIISGVYLWYPKKRTAKQK